MIHHIYWQGLQPSVYESLLRFKDLSDTVYPRQRKGGRAVLESGITGKFDPKDLLADVIKEGVGHSFVFVLTNGIWENFKRWVDDHKLNRYILHEMPDFITNGNHPHNGRNLRLVVMMTEDHPYRDLFRLTDEEIEYYAA
jgi:hypothetical protein